MFLVAPHIVFLLAILGVALANESPLLGLVSAALYGAGLYRTYRRGISIHRITENSIGVIALVAAWVTSQVQGEHFLFCFQYFLAAVLLIRAYRRLEKRDYASSFLVSAVLYGHIGRVYEGLPFLFLTLILLAVGPYGLFSFLATYGGFHKKEELRAGRPVRLTGRHVACMSAVSLALLVVSIGVFLLLPRPKHMTVLGIGDQRERMSGFSSEVSLGSFSRIVRNDNVVMVVETDTPTMWRGTVLDYYDSGTWKGVAKFMRRFPYEPAPVRPGVKTVARRFEIFNVALTDYELFSAGEIISARRVDGDWDIWINDLYASLTLNRPRVRDRHGVYEVVARDVEYLGPTDLREGSWHDPSRDNNWIADRLFVQLPPSLSPRVRQLAEHLTRDADTIEERVRAVQKHLGRGFGYSLEDLDSGDQPPLDYFLFTARRGHCEYFATAMAILLRCAGVQTRVVQGFSPGTFVDGRCVVRLSDAHLWTEVFYPGKGWKAYDPTPGYEGRGRVRTETGFFEKIRLQWQTYVLQYDGATQAGLFDTVTQAINAAVMAIRHRLPPWRQLVAWAAALASAIAAALWLVQLLRRLPRRGSGGAGAQSVSRVRSYFGQYLKALSRRGYRRDPGTTPNDLLRALVQDKADVIDDAEVLTALFYSARFGGAILTRDDERRIKAALTRIRQWAR